MKKVIEVSIIAIVGILVYGLITLLPNFFPRELKTFENDSELRTAALRSFSPMPKTYDEIIKLTNINPNNPLTKEKITLGKKLFNDKNLSQNRDISCSTCHVLKDGGADNLPTALGDTFQENPFHLNTPTVLNSSLYFRQFWDGRVKNVEEQASGPIQASFEMNMSKEEIVKRINENKNYIKSLKSQNLEVNFENIVNAIAAYERTLVTRGAFDDYLDGDDSAINEKAKKGLGIFITRGCKGCHAGLTIGSQSIQKFPLHSWWNEWLALELIKSKDSFLPEIVVKDNSFPFKNTGGFKGLNNDQKFKVPSLRNVVRTAPYFHNGEIKELKEAVRIMGKYQLGQIFTEEEIEEIVEFLKTLDGKIVYKEY
ncbi:cytochrome c peroxidase [uncultured Arcobacter sp.]|uniref:cytochrome-c peroxidase n=1 Tax=uncultured Arcobacter sp. TaxID=165434 RepID=UPI0026155D81|nr:cytochrome c peroxidase [uncultured Arcobacter sp.]